MKQTAVEWLIDEIEKHYIINNGSLNPTVVMELKRQAKEMEKEQKIEFANDYGFHRFCGYDYENAEEYYNKTHKV